MQSSDLCNHHKLCVIRYDKPNQIEHIYSRVAQYLSQENNIVVYITDDDDNPNHLLSYLSSQDNVKVKNNIERGLPIIHGRSAFYEEVLFLDEAKNKSNNRKRRGGNDNKNNDSSMLEEKISHILKNIIAKQDKSSSRGTANLDNINRNNAAAASVDITSVHIMIVNPMTILTQNDNWLVIESGLNKVTKNSMMIEVACIYDESTLSSASLRDLLHIAGTHRNTLHLGWFQSEWRVDRIINIIQSSLDRSLGAGAGRLIFKTMNLIYKMKDDDIFERPKLFEDTLQKILGNAATDIMKSVTEDIIEQMRFVFSFDAI